MRIEHSQRRVSLGNVSLQLNEADLSGKLIIEAQNIYHQYHHKNIIRDFSIRIMRGDRIGLIGPNGVGKSTLLNILLKNIEPQQGTVSQGTKLKIRYFDQLRETLDLEKSIVDNIRQGSDTIEINNKPRHIMSYLGDFLFTPERARTPVKALSGGECSRVLLARLFSQPSNLLILDEPTNDLDIETLELLEEMLCDYQGTLLVVSHDRAFLDNVVTSTLVFEGDGKIQAYTGGYQDWLRQRKVNIPSLDKESKTNKTLIKKTPKLNAKEVSELKGLPKKIEQLETEQTTLQALISDPKFYEQNSESIKQTLSDLAKITSNIEQLYLRWEELEKLNQD